jgi:hypothetical protein
MFKEASKLKLRFTTARGMITTEDLWTLPLKSEVQTTLDLDTVARTIDTALNGVQKSFVKADLNAKEQKESELNTLRMNIVMDVITTKQAEEKESRKAKAKSSEAARKRELLKEAIIIEEAKKLVDGKSLKELKKELKELS